MKIQNVILYFQIGNVCDFSVAYIYISGQITLRLASSTIDRTNVGTGTGGSGENLVSMVEVCYCLHIFNQMVQV